MNFIAKKKKQLSSTLGFKERKCLEAGGGDNGISATPVKKTSGFRWVDMTQRGEGAGLGHSESLPLNRGIGSGRGRWVPWPDHSRGVRQRQRAGDLGKSSAGLRKFQNPSLQREIVSVNSKAGLIAFKSQTLSLTSCYGLGQATWPL